MGKFIKVIKTGIDVSKVKEQLEQYPDDWFIQRKGADTLLERGYADIDVGNLQLIMCAVAKKDDIYLLYDNRFPHQYVLLHIHQLVRQEIHNDRFPYSQTLL